MPYAIIRRKNGRRHEVDFGDAAVRVEIHSSEETVEISIEADFETLPHGSRRFAILNIPRTSLAQPPDRQHDVPQSLITEPWPRQLSPSPLIVENVPGPLNRGNGRPGRCSVKFHYYFLRLFERRSLIARRLSPD